MGVGGRGGGEDMEQCHQMSHGREGGSWECHVLFEWPLTFYQKLISVLWLDGK